MHRLDQILYYLRESPMLAAGLCMILLVVLFGILGPIFVDTSKAQPLATPPRQAPSLEHPFGTDDSGRDLLAVMVVGVPLTMRIGLLAGTVGLGLGIFLGFTSGYMGGKIDTVIRGLVDTLLTVPGLVVLVSIASTIREEISVNIMALVVASLAWMWPTRTIRSQVLTMRERAYVQMAKLNGMSNAEIIWKELFPNLLPYLAANFTNAVNWAILSSIGLEALGLGPQNDPTVGMTIYWAITFSCAHSRHVVVVGDPNLLYRRDLRRLVDDRGGLRRAGQPQTAQGRMSKADKEVLLDIRDLEVHFETRRGIARAVNKVDLTLYKGERFGLVGESGSGKTTLILALLRMIKTPGLIAGGRATLDDGTDLIQLDREQVRQARLKRVAMVPQGAMNSLNPVMRIGDQLMLTMREHAVEEQPPPRPRKWSARSNCWQGWAEAGSGPSVPSRIERRHEAAGLHCPSHLAQPAAHLGRRTDLCARRGGAAANHADLAPATAPAQRHRALGGPRHGPDGAVRRARGHHVRRQIGRGGPGRGDFSQSATPLHSTSDFQHSLV